MIRRALALLLILLPLASAAQDFVIRSFDSAITVHPDASLQIKETITVVFSQPKRGIFRTVPYRYRTDSGQDRIAQVTNLTATYADGSDPGRSLSDNGHSKTLRLGYPDKFLQANKPYTYIIQYRVDRAFNWFDQTQTWEPWAELYWNITGNDWQAPIQKSSVVVDFPPAQDLKPLRARLYWGPTGSTKHLQVIGPTSTKTAAAELFLKKGRFRANLNQTLPNGQGMTIVLALSQESVPKQNLPPPSNPYSGNSNSYSLYDPYNGSFIRTPGPDPLGFALPVGVFLLFGTIWLFRGRDPKLGPVTPQFAPPEGLGPAECGLLLDNRVDPRDITAGLVNLAVHGYIKFVTTNSHGRFTPQETQIHFTGKTPTSDITSTETTLLYQLSPESGYLPVNNLKNVLGPNLRTVIQRLKFDLKHRGYYRALPEDVIGQTSIWGCSIIAASFFFGIAFSTYTNPAASYGIGAGISLLIVAWFATIMPRRTPEGARAHHHVAGLYEAMSRREHYMEWFSKTNLDQSRYEALLPYAISFGLTETWSDLGVKTFDHRPDWVEFDESISSFNASTFDLGVFNESFFDSLRYVSNHEIREVRPPVDHSGWFTSIGSNDDSDFWGSGGSGFGGGGGGGFGGFGGGGFGGGSSGGGGGRSGGGGGGGGGGSW